LGHKRQIGPLLAALAPPVNSDFRPFVQLEAPRARYQGTTARAIQNLSTATIPLMQMLQGAPGYLRAAAPEYDTAPLIRALAAAAESARLPREPGADPLGSPENTARETALVLKRPGALCGSEPSRTAIERLHAAAELTIGHVAHEQARALWIERRWLGCTPRSAYLGQRLELYAALAGGDGKAMVSRARALLEGPAQGGGNW